MSKLPLELSKYLKKFHNNMEIYNMIEISLDFSKSPKKNP